MQHLIINFSICLFSLWLVYKLLLENTNWHQFKRYYFLAAMLISAVIPFIVVRTVVIPFASGGTIDFTTMELATSEVIETGFTLDWNLILLGIYCIGVIIMAARFIKNLYDLRIKTSDEVSSYENYKLVLRELIQIPHSFFGRIYAFKTDYQSGAIPDTVLQHEKAHLDQKHSIDILFIELFIVLMWFNPLLYLIKYSIKLNHEFLADQAVLANGVDTKSYQETLLEYSSNSHHRALANTFNFPIIKKRFTIMKTNTTTASGLLRSLALIPVLAILLVACGEEEVVVEPEVIEIIVEENFGQKSNEKIIHIKAGVKSGFTLVENEEYTFENGPDGIKIYNLSGKLQDFESQGYVIEEIEITEILVEVELSQDDIADYNRLAKKHAAIIEEKGHSIYFKGDTGRMKVLWHNMSIEERANAEPWPYLVFDGNKAGEIAPPPSPQPWFTHTPTLLKGMEDGSIRLMIDGKSATPARAKSLPEIWIKTDYLIKNEDGITIIDYSGKLN